MLNEKTFIFSCEKTLVLVLSHLNRMSFKSCGQAEREIVQSSFRAELDKNREDIEHNTCQKSGTSARSYWRPTPLPLEASSNQIARQASLLYIATAAPSVRGHCHWRGPHRRRRRTRAPGCVSAKGSSPRDPQCPSFRPWRAVSPTGPACCRAQAQAWKSGSVCAAGHTGSRPSRRRQGGRGLRCHPTSPWQKTTAWKWHVMCVPSTSRQACFFFHDFSTRVKILIRVEPQTLR